MNTTSDHPNPELNTGEFDKAMQFALVALALVILIKLSCCICTRVCICICVARPPRFSLAVAEDDDRTATIALSLDDATLGSFPRLLYSQAKAAGGTGSTFASSSCCSICLSDYKDTDMLRMLPGCGHYFHLKCVDVWLRLNPSCPSCRSSPVLIAVGKLLTEVTPVTGSRL